MTGGGNHLAAGLAAALALPAAVLGLDLPVLVALPAAALLYAGVALALAPRRRGERVDASRVGAAQAAVACELIGEGEATVERLRAAAARLRAPALRSAVDGLATAAQGILDRLAAAPEKLPAVRRFLAYYLPQAAEIAGGLAAMDRQGSPDPQRGAAVEATLARLAEAFGFFADNLDRADLRSLDAELKLLDRALAADLGAASPAPSPAPSHATER